MPHTCARCTAYPGYGGSHTPGLVVEVADEVLVLVLDGANPIQPEHRYAGLLHRLPGRGSPCVGTQADSRVNQQKHHPGEAGGLEVGRGRGRALRQALGEGLRRLRLRPRAPVVAGGALAYPWCS